MTLTGGNRNDVTQLIPLVEAVPPIRGRRGRRRPRELFADRGYDHDIYRRRLGSGQLRWVVERSFARLHAFERLRIRYERRADVHLGLLQLACALICYRRLRSF